MHISLAEFELSYRGLVQYRIRPHLDGLTPKEAKTLKLTVLPSAQQVFINLKIAHIESVRNCEKGLKQLLSEPNQVAFAIVEEFVDRTIRAADVEKEWQLLLQLVRSQIWDDFLGEQGQMQHEWINSVEQATTVDEETSEVDAIFALMNM
ncbi:hypothetical protein [Fischerella sp.]|jgi:hypothetical protein|uniref:hypothetical protein n=1 Tax=Fischerella sp. TaxID=1191 RepID=UPI0025C046C3|nr:hypothetical protein [Fischerella sp.]